MEEKENNLEHKLQEAIVALIEEIPKNEDISVEISFKIQLKQTPKDKK